jgi:hypothetical protein
MAEHDPALVDKAAEGALAARWPDGLLVDHVSRKTAPMIARAVLAAVVPAIREAVLLEAAETFRQHERDGYLFIDENHERVPWEAVAQQLERMAAQQREERS